LLTWPDSYFSSQTTHIIIIYFICALQSVHCDSTPLQFVHCAILSKFLQKKYVEMIVQQDHMKTIMNSARTSIMFRLKDPKVLVDLKVPMTMNYRLLEICKKYTSRMGNGNSKISELVFPSRSSFTKQPMSIVFSCTNHIYDFFVCRLSRFWEINCSSILTASVVKFPFFIYISFGQISRLSQFFLRQIVLESSCYPWFRASPVNVLWYII